MSEGTADRFVPMRPRNVYRIVERGDAPEAHVIVLQETDGERILAVWVAGNEAVWLAHALEGVETSRPGPYALMARLLEESGLDLDEVRISRLVDEVYYAELVLRSDGRRVAVDARASDALNLALRLRKPVVVSELGIGGACGMDGPGAASGPRRQRSAGRRRGGHRGRGPRATSQIHDRTAALGLRCWRPR